MYCNVITSAEQGHRIYIGSSWGVYGLNHRVRQHQNPVFCENHPSTHYKVYDELRNVAHILPLVICSEDRVPMPLVVCAEAIMVTIFNALARPGWYAARSVLEYLPQTPKNVGSIKDPHFYLPRLAHEAESRKEEEKAGAGAFAPAGRAD